jgi:flagellar protein FliO/FliZ
VPVFLFILLLTGFSPAAFAQTTNNPAQASNDETQYVIGAPASSGGAQAAVTGSTGPTIWTVLRMVLILAVVAAAVYGIVYFIRKAGNKPDIERNLHVKVLARASLDSNRALYAVKVGTQAWLIGGGEGGLRLIAELQDKEEIDAMEVDYSREAGKPGAKTTFASLLGRFAPKTEGKARTGAGLLAAGSGVVRANRERLRGL